LINFISAYGALTVYICQVSAKLYGILNMLAQQCPSFGRSCVALCVPHLAEKLGDLKLKKPAGEALLAYSEKTSLQFVLGQGTIFLYLP
jgi:cytoskeleton-associated protein 5